MPSLGVACNFYNEANALPGFLEMACRYFDDVLMYHCGPNGEPSDDGSIEIVEKWGARIEFGSIDEGFGVVRTKAAHLSKCEWVMILDADERFHPSAPIFEPTSSGLYVRTGEYHNQGLLLRNLINDANFDAIKTVRRHWWDTTWDKPTQNWFDINDHQLRILRNHPEIGYTQFPKMHERVIDSRIGDAPRHNTPDVVLGPFHDHYHMWFKGMEADQREHDKYNYDSLDQGRPLITHEQFKALGK